MAASIPTRQRAPARAGRGTRQPAPRLAAALPWPVAALAVALAVMLLLRMLLPLSPSAMLTLLATAALVVACVLLLGSPWPGRQRHASAAASLHTLRPAEFERHVADLFMRAGYQARVAGASGDGGVDVRVWWGGRRGIVQCKRYRPDLPVGPAVVRELVGARAHDHADRAWLATTGRLTAGARRLATAEGIVVLDAAALHAWEASLSRRWLRWGLRRASTHP